MDFMKYTKIDVIKEDKGYTEMEVDLESIHLNYYGFVHGGVYFTLSDSAAGGATKSYEGQYVTLNSSISYLNAAKSGKLTAIAKVVNKTKKTVVIDVKTYNNKRQCTTSTFTMYRVK